jgi:hypothetical protein
MKKIIHLISGVFMLNAILLSCAIAQESKFDMQKKQEQKPPVDKYCARQKGEKMIILFEEKILSSEIKLDNGIIIKPDGIMLKADSSQTVLKDGDCVDKEGNIIKPMTRKEEEEPKRQVEKY